MTADLEGRARRVRERVIRMAARGGCFLGASLSVADLLVELYSRTLSVSPRDPRAPERDFLLLSKGHDAPALYATLAEHGFIDPARLESFLVPGHKLYWHPNVEIPGVEFHSGSLGHMLSVGIGIALDAKLRAARTRVFVLVGDGELNEGSVWEACLVAAAHHLDNLVLVVDRNGFQANARTEDLIPLEPLAPKFSAFGWACRTVDGHDFESMGRLFAALPQMPTRPTAVIARTVRGRGIPSLEARADAWFVKLSAAGAEELVAELHAHCAEGVDA